MLVCPQKSRFKLKLLSTERQQRLDKEQGLALALHEERSSGRERRAEGAEQGGGGAEDEAAAVRVRAQVHRVPVQRQAAHRHGQEASQSELVLYAVLECKTY